MAHKTTVYQCDFCKTYRKKEQAILNHERNCFHNPKIKACATCEHLAFEQEDNGLPSDHPYFSFETFQWCEVTEIKNENKYNPGSNKPLTKNCIYWEGRK